MKILRFLPIIVVVSALALVLGTDRQSVAQPAGVDEGKGALGQYERLVSSLSKRGDTNTASEVDNLVSAMNAQRDATDIGMAVHVLEAVRAGRTNDAIRLLETHLDGALITFGAPTDGPRDTQYDKILKMARKYRAKYPHTSGSPEIDSAVARAFNVLPK